MLAAGVSSVVTGVVVDEKGEILKGVSIIVKGSNKATITDEKGVFKLSADTEKDILVFSYIGYKTIEATVKNAKTMNIILAPETKALNEVLVVGYGTQTKAEFTGSSSKVSGATIKGYAGAKF